MTGLPATEEVAWQVDAACRNHDVPDLWFVNESDPDIVAAIDVCNRCPVIDVCRDYALARPGLSYGVWGGLTTAQRHRVRKGRPPGPLARTRGRPVAPCGTRSARRRHRRDGEGYECLDCWGDVA